MQKSWPSGAPQRAAAASAAEMPGTMSSSPACQAGSADSCSASKDGRRHGEDAGIARRDDRHRAARCGKGEGVAGALHLLAIVRDVQGLVGAKGPGHAHVGLVADDVLRFGEGPARSRYAVVDIAGAEADDGEFPGGAPEIDEFIVPRVDRGGGDANAKFSLRISRQAGVREPRRIAFDPHRSRRPAGRTMKRLPAAGLREGVAGVAGSAGRCRSAARRWW